ncbi:hypothetical protein [Cellvibrio sp. QJXJ]|uniref:hypothetical protein n=1 Tax=Cellvibrio sp. QJXJ TaxID=2964606 RepID=UPI0021C42D08|nr:hypothetical protein [Cellvibrio sp. QJXJ]UUA75210.1 hypothetical protein NNX04_22390 [Cellvibrio sp. QJXJ]
MEITALGRYKLSFDSNNFSVVCPLGRAKFSGLATSKLPKLYVASVDGQPIYVGITKQSIRNRLRLGWAATGKAGYYGYAWRHKFSAADFDIWCHTNPNPEGSCLDIETVEAELVFLIRQAGQWPLFQTEIHFHPSTEVHRAIARQIADSYGI